MHLPPRKACKRGTATNWCGLLQDEIFHVPQTQRYCAGKWTEWDSKITTFPGLYFLGVPFGRAARALATVRGLEVLSARPCYLLLSQSVPFMLSSASLLHRTA